MKTYQNDYLSEFEQEFEMNDESTAYGSDFEDPDGEFESGSEPMDDYEMDTEADYLLEPENEFENEFENLPEPGYEARLYELFVNNYESEYEFENDFNKVMYEMERDFFFKKAFNKVKNLARNPVIKSLAKKALGAIPGPAGDLIRKGLQNPRGFLKNAIMKLGPQLANMVVPGSGIVLNAALGNKEMETEDYYQQAAAATVNLARETYENFADEVSRLNLSQSPAQADAQLQHAARKALTKAHNTVKLNSKKYRFRRINRKVEDTTIQGTPGKKVTIWYKRV